MLRRHQRRLVFCDRLHVGLEVDFGMLRFIGDTGSDSASQVFSRQFGGFIVCSKLLQLNESAIRSHLLVLFEVLVLNYNYRRKLNRALDNDTNHIQG